MEATAIAASWSSGLGEWMRTRNSTNDMIVTTSTKMPVKRPVLALVQYTLKCRGKNCHLAVNGFNFFEERQKNASEHENMDEDTCSGELLSG